MTIQGGLSGPEAEELYIALVHAFPSRRELERLVRFKLDIPLNTIAAEGGTLSDAVMHLIEWADARGRVDDLVNGALLENPTSPELLALQARRACGRTCGDEVSTAEQMYETAAMGKVDLSNDLGLLVAEWSQRIDGSMFETMRVPQPARTAEITVLEAKPPDLLRMDATNAYGRYAAQAGHGLDAKDCYLVSRYLLDAIQQNQPADCNLTFLFGIHQHLSSMIRDRLDPNERHKVIVTLKGWLTNSHGPHQTTRNFAAFELGMCRADAAIPHLLNAVENANELRLVRYYGVMALGMIGSAHPDVMVRLVRAYKRESAAALRSAIAHTILFMLLGLSKEVPKFTG